MTESKMKKIPSQSLAKGTPVQVITGPLKGRQGVLLHRANLTRFVIAMQVLGQLITVEIDASALDTI